MVEHEAKCTMRFQDSSAALRVRCFWCRTRLPGCLCMTRLCGAGPSQAKTASHLSPQGSLLSIRGSQLTPQGSLLSPRSSHPNSQGSTAEAMAAAIHSHAAGGHGTAAEATHVDGREEEHARPNGHATHLPASPHRSIQVGLLGQHSAQPVCSPSLAHALSCCCSCVPQSRSCVG